MSQHPSQNLTSPRTMLRRIACSPRSRPLNVRIRPGPSPGSQGDRMPPDTAAAPPMNGIGPHRHPRQRYRRLRRLLTISSASIRPSPTPAATAPPSPSPSSSSTTASTSSSTRRPADSQRRVPPPLLRRRRPQRDPTTTTSPKALHPSPCAPPEPATCSSHERPATVRRPAKTSSTPSTCPAPSTPRLRPAPRPRSRRRQDDRSCARHAGPARPPATSISPSSASRPPPPIPHASISRHLRRIGRDCPLDAPRLALQHRPHLARPRQIRRPAHPAASRVQASQRQAPPTPKAKPTPSK